MVENLATRSSPTCSTTPDRWTAIGATTMLLAAGVHPKVVQERLGHATVAIILDTYSHVMGSLQREAADRIDELLG